MHHLNLKSCPTNPDEWMGPSKKDDGFLSYDYIQFYMENTIVISKNNEQILRGEIGKYFELKEESVGPPNIYLGGHVQKTKLHNMMTTWSFSSSQYVTTAVKNMEEYVKTDES